MKTYVHLWYLAQFFPQWEIFQAEVVEKIKTDIFSSITFSHKEQESNLILPEHDDDDNIFPFQNRAIYEIMWKNSAQRERPQMTIWCKRITCWMPKAKTHTQNMQHLLLFPRNNGCTNAPQCYVVCTLPAFSNLQIRVPFIGGFCWTNN